MQRCDGHITFSQHADIGATFRDAGRRIAADPIIWDGRADQSARRGGYDTRAIPGASDENPRISSSRKNGTLTFNKIS